MKWKEGEFKSALLWRSQEGAWKNAVKEKEQGHTSAGEGAQTVLQASICRGFDGHV